MCIIVRETKRKSVTGWKIVGQRDDGKYYSLFTGKDYINGEECPPPEFVDSCIYVGNTNSSVYISDGMRGRTGLFKNRKTAEYMRASLCCITNPDTGDYFKKRAKVVKMTISGDIAEGRVGFGCGSTRTCYMGLIISWEE